MTLIKPSVYIETTIPSYLVGRPSRDVIVFAHQELTWTWWTKYRKYFSLYTSEFVLDEIANGDQVISSKRLETLEKVELLDLDDEIRKLAAIYLQKLSIPNSAATDTLHIACAVFHKIDYMLTWNCKHLANASIRRHLQAINHGLGLSTPDLCTPEELLIKEVK